MPSRLRNSICLPKIGDAAGADDEGRRSRFQLLTPLQGDAVLKTFLQSISQRASPGADLDIGTHPTQHSILVTMSCIDTRDRRDVTGISETLFPSRIFPALGRFSEHITVVK